MTTSPILHNLNPAQQRAVQTVDGPVLVLAGPGSGKTRVLTHRVAYLIETMGIDPLNILAVTFTNKAAREMKERLNNLIGTSEATSITVGTFHSICTRFLRRDCPHLGFDRDFTIYDADDQERLMRQIIRGLNLNDKQNKPRAILSRVSRLKNELRTPAQFLNDPQREPSYNDEIVYRCYLEYQKALRQNNALDFDDLLIETVRLFSEHPEVLGWYHRRYRYLLVDEYQDTNHAQYTLVRLLAQQHRNLFVVGDEDQGVYSWRGADIRNILQFETDYPDASVILLEQNYRSTQAILDTAQAVIRGGTQRKHTKKLWTENSGGVHVTLMEGYDQNDEAQCVVDEISRLMRESGHAPSDIAVMYRTNAQSRALEEAFVSQGVNYQLVGGIRFYERKEVKDILAYLRLAQNPHDNVSLSRVINVPKRSIGKRAQDTLQQWANNLGVAPLDALEQFAADTSIDTPFNTRTSNALLQFRRIIAQLREATRQHSLATAIEELLATLEYRDMLLKEYDEEEGEERWNNLKELCRVAEEYAFLEPAAQLTTFLEEVSLYTDMDMADRQQADAVTCITLHQAKGLEYPVVFLIGLEEGLLPHSRSMDTRESIEEERRLLYVGATRAKEQLYLLYAFRRLTYGGYDYTTCSRFLADIPPDLIKRPGREKRPAPAPQTTMFTQRSGYAPPPSSPAPPPPSPPRAAPGTKQQRTRRTTRPKNEPGMSFSPGQRVRHPNHGDGVVVSSRMVIGDEEVTIAFQDTERKLLASFARLKRLD